MVLHQGYTVAEIHHNIENAHLHLKNLVQPLPLYHTMN